MQSPTITEFIFHLKTLQAIVLLWYRRFIRIEQAYSDAWSPADATISMESAPARTSHLAAHGQPITCLTPV